MKFILHCFVFGFHYLLLRRGLNFIKLIDFIRQLKDNGYGNSCVARVVNLTPPRVFGCPGII